MNESLVDPERAPARSDWDIICNVEYPGRHLLFFATVMVIFYVVNIITIQVWCWMQGWYVADWPFVLTTLSLEAAYCLLGLVTGFQYARLLYLGSPPVKYINDGDA